MLAADVQRSPSSSAATEESAAALRLRSEVLQLKTECESLRSTLGDRDRELQQVQQAACGLAAEREESARLVSELQQQLQTLSTAPPPAPIVEPHASEVDSAELDELRARFEMAVEDIRTLKAENRDLEARLSSAAPVAKPLGGGSDWEARKRQLLASLEEELGFNDERAEERATIEGTIRITDEVLAEKQREIDALLAERSVEITQAAAAADHTELFDADEVIAAERQRIATLRADWETKLCAAELDLSIERAKNRPRAIGTRPVADGTGNFARRGWRGSIVLNRPKTTPLAR